jgi:hypothetical protein
MATRLGRAIRRKLLKFGGGNKTEAAAPNHRPHKRLPFCAGGLDKLPKLELATASRPYGAFGRKALEPVAVNGPQTLTERGSAKAERISERWRPSEASSPSEAPSKRAWPPLGSPSASLRPSKAAAAKAVARLRKIRPGTRSLWPPYPPPGGPRGGPQGVSRRGRGRESQLWPNRRPDVFHSDR